MANVLAVVGSPRKGGNTDILVSRIADGARDSGAAVDLLHLGDLEIRECNGCHACWRGKPCSHDDAMQPIYSQIATADAIVFGTPVYWYGPTALMKAFVDRFVYFNCGHNRPKIRGKRAVVAVVLEEESKSTWQPVVEFFDHCFAYLKLRPAGTIVVPGVRPKGAIRAKPERLEQAYHLGASLQADD